MADTIDSLSDDDIRRIALLVETLDRSGFDYLTLDVGGMKLTIGKGEPPSGQAPVAGAGEARASAPAEVANPGLSRSETIASVPPPASEKQGVPESPADEDTITIVASILGRFYGTPQPGAPDFVSVGDEVTPETTIGLIEVMKVFTAIPAGVSGVVTEICVKTGQFVEYGQVLLRVRPVASAAASAPARPKRTRAR